MIGISIAAKLEWNTVLKFYNINEDDLSLFPFGEYFQKKINDKNIVFYRCGVRKVNSSSSAQYMISKFNLNKIIVLGSCAGINDKYDKLDIFIADKAVQYDCTIKEIEPLIKETFIVELPTKSYKFKHNIGTIGTADKAVVMWKDYLEIKKNNIDIADTESGAIAYVCKKNDVQCIIAKGISDFPLENNNLENEQLETFKNNVPIIMNNLLENYLEELVE